VALAFSESALYGAGGYPSSTRMSWLRAPIMLVIGGLEVPDFAPSGACNYLTVHLMSVPGPPGCGQSANRPVARRLLTATASWRPSALRWVDALATVPAAEKG